MSFEKNAAGQGVAVFARDFAANEGRTGYASFLDMYISKDGAAPAETSETTGTGEMAEIGVGFYWLPFTQAETNADLMLIYGDVTGTGSVAVDPMQIATVAGTGGGDATLANQTIMIGHLTDIKGAGFGVGTHSLAETATLAEQKVQVDQSLVDIGLHKITYEAIGTGNIADSSVVSSLVSKAATPSWATYDNQTDSLEAISDGVTAIGTGTWGGGGGDATLANQTTMIGHLTDIKGGGFTGVTDSLEAISDAVAGTGTSASSPELMLTTTIVSATSQTELILSNGSTDNNAYRYCLVLLTNDSDASQKSVVRATGYTGSTKTITLEDNPAFTVGTGDIVQVLADYTTNLTVSGLASVVDGILQDDVSLRTTSNTVGRAIGTLRTVGERTNNANLNSLAGVPDAVGRTIVTDVYYVKYLRPIIDDVQSRDEYRGIRWYKNDTPLDSGVTSPKIRVINAETGSDLIAETAISEAGTSHLFMYNATGAERSSAGEGYAIRFKATIDGQIRVHEAFFGRDA